MQAHKLSDIVCVLCVLRGTNTEVHCQIGHVAASRAGGNELTILSWSEPTRSIEYIIQLLDKNEILNDKLECGVIRKSFSE